jgi:LacI family transcriptional regulator
MSSSTPASAVSRVTINDVARQCGLSIATVSKVLNRRSQARIPAPTQERVLEVAKELGYRPSYLARALANQRSHTIGVLYAPPMALIPRGIYESLMDELDRVLSARGYQLMFVRLTDHVEQWRQILQDQRFDGCLVLSGAPPAVVEMLAGSAMPCVLVNLKSETPLPSVQTDDFDGAVQVTRHLIELGHQKIGYYADVNEPHYSAERRHAGYCHAMAEAGLTTMEPFGGETAALAERLKREPGLVSAVIAYQHRIAVCLLQSLWRQGLSVPGDVSVATFNNAYPVEQTIPPLTAVALPTVEMGRRAAEMLLDRVERPGEAPVEGVVLKERLVVRESTGPVRVSPHSRRS